MLKELVQELNEILGAVETLTAENENMKNEIKVKEDRTFWKEIQIKILYVVNNNHYRRIRGGGVRFYNI